MSNEGQVPDVARLMQENAQLKRELQELRDYSQEQNDSVELYEFLTRHVADLLAVIDTQGRRIWNNRAYRETLGYSPEELEATNSFIEIHPDDRHLVETTFTESIQNGVGRTIQYRMKHKEGHWVPLESNAQVVHKADGSVRAIVLVARDITNRLKFQEEQEKLKKMQALAEFSHKISESFNHYTAEIIAKVSLLSKALPASSPEKELVAEIMQVADKSQQMIRELMSLSEADDSTFHEVGFRGLVLKAMAQVIPAGNLIQLHENICSDPVTMHASAEDLSQAVIAMLKNAVEAMPGGGALQVELSVEHRETVANRLQPGTYAVLKIRDQGEGFPADQKNKLFEPYFTTKAGHQGLGLTNALKTVSDHEGALFLETKEGVGTEVSFFLPVTIEEPLQSIPAETSTENSVPAAVPLSSQTVEPKPKPKRFGKKLQRRVLVMDQEAFVREFSSAMLEQLGYKAHSVESSGALLREFKEAQRKGRSYHLVVTDVMAAEDEEGQSMARRLKSISPFTKVIAASSDSDHPVLQQPESFGFHASMRKPYQLDRMTEVLNSIFPHT